jgi:hypothetical protein
MQFCEAATFRKPARLELWLAYGVYESSLSICSGGESSTSNTWRGFLHADCGGGFGLRGTGGGRLLCRHGS